jgi:hypothetical protein
MNQAILKLIDKKIQEHKDSTWYAIWDIRYRTAIDALEWVKNELSSLPSDTQWIDINEEYPEDNTMVLGYTDFIVWVNLWWATESWEWRWDWWIQYTHWMPLPTPPKN